MSMGSLKTLTEDHHCHDILLDPSILTDHGQWHADPSSNSSSDFSPDLGSESDATTVGDKHQTPQGTQGLSSTMATDQPTLPSEGSKSSDEGSNSPSPLLSSSEEGDLARSELSHGAESCQLDPVPGSFKETTVLGTDSMSPSHVSVNNVDRPNQPGDGDDKSDVTTGQSVQRGGEGAGEEKSCPPIRRDVSQEITILVTSHDTCVGDEEEGELEEEGEVEEEEEEKEREEGKEESKKARNELERESSSKNIREEETRALSQDAVTPADREAAVEGSIVVANLTSTSQVEIPQIVGSNSLETGRDRASNAQCEDTEVTSGNQEASDPISSSSSDCLLEAQTEAKRPTELNKPLVDVVSTDLSSQCISQTKSVPTESEPVTVSDNTTTDHKNVGQLSTTTNKSSISDSKERLQKAKTLDLSSSRFSVSPRKTATVQGQSSLEVVACHSVATSPMTPPEGSGAFLFPYSSAKLGTGNGNIEEKREFRSVATAPMSPQNLTAPEALPDVRTAGVEMISVATAPMTPQNLTAPEGIPDVRTAGVEMRSVATAPMTPQHLTAPEAIPDTHSAGVEMISVATAPMTPQNLTAPESIPDVRTEMRSVATAPMTPQTLTAPEELPDVRTAGMEMRSVATAPMTPQNLTAPEAIPDVPTAGVETRSVATAPMTPQNLTAPESIPDVHTERRSVATAPMTPQTLTAPEELPDVRTAGMEMRSVATAPMTPQNLTAPEAIPDVRTAGVEMRSVATAPMSPQNLTAPESIPDTRKVGSVQTQKSLEVMYNSVATSPMTPPGGSTAFLFPKPNKIELRSMATAPMSPQGLVAPEVIPETCPSDQEEPTSPDIIPEPRACEPSNALPEPPDPVQDVSWDEKGMTWDVYGAVVEVAVLGTAIQKHLEKQVQKQRKQTSSDAGSPTKSQHSDQNLTQSQSPADTQSSDDRVSSAPATGPVTSGSQKRRHPKEEKSDSVKRNGRRKNPLRGRFRRLQWPSCCSRSRAEEVP